MCGEDLPGPCGHIDHGDPEIRELVDALAETGVVTLTGNCASRFFRDEKCECNDSPLAWVRFHALDSARAIKLVEEIMRVVTDEDDEIDVSLQLHASADDKNDIVWNLEFMPIIPPEMFFDDWEKASIQTKCTSG